MNHYTLDEVMAWHPCYSREKVEALFAGRRTITLLDALDMDIPLADMIYAAHRMEEELYVGGRRALKTGFDFTDWLREQLEREDPVLERMEKVEEDLNRQLKIVRHEAFNGAGSLNKRLENLEGLFKALDDWSKRHVEVRHPNDKQTENPTVCEGCNRDTTCDHARSKICNIAGDGHPCCYRTPWYKPPAPPKTCGTCKHLHKPKDYDRWNNLPYYAFCWVKYDGVCEAWWESNEAETWEACPKYEAVK